MVYLSHFVIAFVVSYLASLPFGMINLTVVQITLNKSFKQAMYFSLAAASIEFFQAFLAVKFAGYIQTHPVLDLIMQIMVVPVFLGLGISYVLKKTNKPPKEKKKKKQRKINTESSFVKGILIGLLNPLAIPFWVIVSGGIASRGYLEYTNLKIAIFAIGISIGTFFCLFTFGKAAQLVASRSVWLKKRVERIIGIIFIGLGTYQVIHVIHLIFTKYHDMLFT